MTPRNTAIIYHYLAHYREAVCSQLSKQDHPNPRYTLFSDTKSNSDIQVIDPKKSQIDISNGGLRWRFIKNYWLTKDIMWQSGVIKLALSKEFNTLIFLGHMYFLSYWVGAIIGRLTGKRVFMWTHGYIREENNLKGWIRAIFYKLANGVLLYGNRARKMMINKGFSPERLYVIYNSLNYSVQKSIRSNISEEECNSLKANLFSHNDLPVLLFVGRLTTQKKLDMLLTASHFLDKKGVRVNILFVGGGKEEDSLKNLAIDLGLAERVKFFGPCYEEEKLAKLIMTSDICVAPGEVGLTAMHSLAYGTPVITHNDFSRQMPEYEAIQEGVSGLFFQQGDCEDLGEKIKAWLSNNKSKTEIREQCIEIIESHYNPEYQCEIINKAVSGYPACS